MSLRDYFAAKALQGLLAQPDTLYGFHAASEDREAGDYDAILAKCVYRLADAMLAERAR